jgi:hypothetical protein
MLDVLASVALPLVGSVLAGNKIKDTSKGAGQAYNEGIKYLEEIYIPSVVEQQVNWQDLVLAAQQAGADRRALESLLAAGRGEERRMGAAQRAAQLGSQLRGQEFGEEQARSEADRLIDQFNKQMQFRTQEENLGRAERARFQNMADRRRAEELNAQRRYESAIRNANLKQQRFQNELARGQAMMGGKGGVAAASESAADREMRLYGGGIGGAGQILGSYMAGKGKDDAFFNKMQQYEKWKQGRK